MELTYELSPFNVARQKAYNSLDITLNDLYGKSNISEKEFKNRWQENLAKETNIIADGWYNPPPKGMAVLFGDRVSFDTLRNQNNWASDKIINWKEDLLYAYCSPIDKTSGIIGDISITLYFGKDKKIIEHINKCHIAIIEVFNILDKVKNSNELFIASEKIFAKNKLKNCIISKTDNISLDLGHTFPKLEGIQRKNILTEEEKQKISKSRQFINENSTWNFIEGIQFTIEPQLISTIDSTLPQISQHYLVKKENGKFIISKDIDEMLEKYKLI